MPSSMAVLSRSLSHHGKGQETTIGIRLYHHRQFNAERQLPDIESQGASRIDVVTS